MGLNKEDIIMPKSSNQKMKILYVLDYLMRKSDENHVVSMNEILDYLSEQNIQAERKSIYNDMEALREFGIDIITTRGKKSGFFIGTRDFQLPELKLLVDSIQSSKFITEKKTIELIKKLEGLSSEWDGKDLQRQVYVQNRVKSMNESVYYNVDDISRAINEDKKIQFQYVVYNLKKERTYRHDGKVYSVSPFALVMDNQNYYLVGWEAATSTMKHFRVDLMERISVSKEKRDGKDEFKKVSMENYAKEMFNMFGGVDQQIKLRVHNRLIGVILDRFGRNVWISQEEGDYFNAHVTVSASPQFYGWLFSFGKDMEVISPDSVREEMLKLTQIALETYEKK